MLASLVAYVLIFFSPARKQGEIKVSNFHDKPLSEREKQYYLYKLGLTLVEYGPEYSYLYNSTLSKLPSASSGEIVLVRSGRGLKIESANGEIETTPENLTRDLCSLMVYKNLPDCLVGE